MQGLDCYHQGSLYTETLLEREACIILYLVSSKSADSWRTINIWSYNLHQVSEVLRHYWSVYSCYLPLSSKSAESWMTVNIWCWDLHLVFLDIILSWFKSGNYNWYHAIDVYVNRSKRTTEYKLGLQCRSCSVWYIDVLDAITLWYQVAHHHHHYHCWQRWLVITLATRGENKIVYGIMELSNIFIVYQYDIITTQWRQ